VDDHAAVLPKRLALFTAKMFEDAALDFLSHEHAV
jgi:hypothetical protein